MRALVWRYIIAMHRRQELSVVDVNEVKGGISTLRFELLEVFKNNGMDISCASKNTKSKSRDAFNSIFKKYLTLLTITDFV